MRERAEGDRHARRVGSPERRPNSPKAENATERLLLRSDPNFRSDLRRTLTGVHHGYLGAFHRGEACCALGARDLRLIVEGELLVAIPSLDGERLRGDI